MASNKDLNRLKVISFSGIVAEAMKEMKYVNMFNQGIRRVQDMLCENGNPEAEFIVEKLTAFEVKVRPTISINLVTDD